MGKSIYIADSVVAEAYRVAPGEWVWIQDDAEVEYLVLSRYAYTLERPAAVPPAYQVHPDAQPFEPYTPGKPPKPPKPDKPDKPPRTRAAT